MSRIRKTTVLLLTLTIALSCLTLVLRPVNAQTIPKPSVPQLSISFVNHSYDVPSTTTTTTNPYTGENIATIKEGYHVQNDSFVLSVRSQPLTINDKVDGNSIKLFFIVQSKGHYSDYWKNLTYVGDSWPFIYTNNGFAQKTMQLSGNNGTTYAEEGGYNNYGYDGFVGGQYGGQVDFRAMSVIGYSVTVKDDINIFNFRYPYHEEFVALQSSDWSPIHTVSVPDGKVTISEATNQTPTPTVLELPSLVIIPLLLSVFFVAVLLRHKKSRKSS